VSQLRIKLQVITTLNVLYAFYWAVSTFQHHSRAH